MKLVKYLCMASTALAGQGLITNSSAADEDETFTIEEVIVTSQRRAQNIMDVPISISAISGEDLDNSGMQNIEEMAMSVTNMTLLPSQNNSNMAVSIRGLFTSDNDPGLDAGVSVYVDEVLLGRDFAWKSNLMDIERIEVLKGPQGTIFGKNTISGAINIITKKPSDDLEAHADINYGNFNLIQVRTSVGGALVEDKISARVSMVYRNRDGYLKNVLGGRLNEEDSISGRLQLYIRPTEKLSIMLAADVADNNGNSNYVDPIAGLGTTPADANPFDRKVAIDRPGFENRNIWGTSATITYEMENGYEIKSISAYRNNKLRNETDQDYLPLPIFFTARDFAQTQFTQELRIASPSDEKFEWLAGVYYLDSNLSASSALTFQDAFFGTVFDPSFFGSGLSATADTVADIKTKSYAAYFNSTYNFTERLSLNLGLRYTKENKDGVIGQIITEPSFFPALTVFMGFPRITPRPETLSSSNLSPTISLAFAINDDVNTYVKWARGFKSGGFVASLIAPGDNDITFKPEIVDSFEIGLKMMGLEDRLRFNAAVFYMNYTDMQIQQNVFGNLKDVTNAGEATLKGFEADIMLLPVPGLELTAGVGYVDATFDKFDNCIGATSCAGNRLPLAPEWQINGSAQYTRPIGSGLEFLIRADVNHQTGAFWEPTNITNSGFPGIMVNYQEPYTLVNARIGIGSENNGWNLSFWAKNLFDEEFIIDNYDTGGGTIVSQVNSPRTYGVQFSVRY